MRKCLALVACLAAALLSGCSFSVGSDEEAGPMSQADLEKKLADTIEPDDSDAEVKAECSGDLEAEVDASQDCHITVGEEFSDVHVVVTEVEDDAISDWRLDTFVPPDRLGEAIKSSLEDQGFNVDTVDCPDELPGEMDATVHCTVAPAEGTGDIEVKVDDVDGLRLHFNYEVVG